MPVWACESPDVLPKCCLPMRRKPPTNEPWIIHSINIHGTFFEAWCRDVATRASEWVLAYYNYPVDWAAHESPLDLIPHNPLRNLGTLRGILGFKDAKGAKNPWRLGECLRASLEGSC